MAIKVCYTPLVVLLLACTVSAQQTPVLPPPQPEQDACNAIPICGNYTLPYTYKGKGNTTELQYFYNGCFDETNSVWLRLKVGISGTIVFTIDPLNQSNDINFAVFKITGSVQCSTVASSLPIRCNGIYTAGGPATLLAADAINANAGDEYLILVENHIYNSSLFQSGFSIDFNGSTAAFVNDALPHFNSVNNTCNKSQEVTVKLSKPVKCNSIASNGSDFYLTPAAGNVQGAYGFNCAQSTSGYSYSGEVTIQFANPLPPGSYWLHAKKGIDGNSLSDLCGGEQAIGDSISFTVAPYTPIVFSGFKSPACQFLVVGLSHKVNCDSVAADGSDFKVAGPSPVAVTAASGINCDVHGLADTLLVALQSPIKADGVYYLLSQKGSDNNTLIDSCTGQMLAGTQLSFEIDSYNGNLVAGTDTVLCKADTIYLTANSSSWMNATCCGIDTSTQENGCISISKRIGGIPGSTGTDGRYSRLIFPPLRGSRKQMLFRASELQAMGLKPGRITKLGWIVDPNADQFVQPVPLPSWWPPPFATISEFQIKLGCTGLFELSGSSMVDGLHTVYSTSDYVPIGGINEFMLDSSYNWDGVSNLIVEVCSSTQPGTSQVIAAITELSTTSFISVSTFMSASQDGCSLTTATGSNIGPGTNDRPDIRFTICGPPVPLAEPYQWTPQNLVSNSSSPNTTAFPTSTTNFLVTTSDRFGCFLRDTVEVVVSELMPSITPLETSICLGDSVRLLAQAGTMPAYYNWIAADPGSLNCLDCQAPVAQPHDTTIYQVTVSDRYGCADTLTALVKVLPLPVISVSPEDTIIKYGSSIQLHATGADIYTWSPAGTLDIPFIADPVASPLEPTRYIVVGLDNNNCRNSDSMLVAIDYNDNLFVPSAFSPDGDGKNDLFRVANLSFQKIQEFRVFNRWGQEVYTAFDNRGWDGTIKGLRQDMGVYHYLIRVGIPDGRSVMYKGDVTLVR